MKRGLLLSIAWTGVTLLAVVIAAAAVGSLRSHVTREPTALGSPMTADLAIDTVATTVRPLDGSQGADSATSTKTYTTSGGTVRIGISDPSVTFSGAVPNPGWKVNVDHAGPDKVKVTFKQNDHDGNEIEFRAQFDHGELVVSIDDR